jgi:hypothetical protein
MLVPLIIAIVLVLLLVLAALPLRPQGRAMDPRTPMRDDEFRRPPDETDLP